MSPKRLDRIAPPPTGDEWDLRFGTSEAAKGWPDLSTHAQENTRAAYELMRSNPRPPEDVTHYRLRGALGSRMVGGHAIEQWQIKVSSGARIWYVIDDEKRTVWVTYASPAHPKSTE